MQPEGMANDEIAACLDTRREVFCLWRERFFVDRLSGLEDHARPGRPRTFPPDLAVQVQALACALPAKHGPPLSRRADLVQQVHQSGLVASVSGSTLWRWLHETRFGWYHRSWIYPRHPDFAVKAGRVLDLYARQWQGSALRQDEFVISADEKMIDMHHARIFGRCEAKHGIAPFDRLVEQVMTRPPYTDARRVLWIVDNCSTHRDIKAVERLRSRYPRLTLVHAPVHASWLNQIEIYCSIVRRKVLTSNDLPISTP